MKWNYPFAAIISGPSGSGKFHFIERFLRNLNQMVNVKFEIAKISNIALGLPLVSDFSSDNKPKLIILDDLQPRQVYPESPKFLQEAYYDATDKPHGYILLNLKQDTQELFRVRTNIFRDESPNYVYVPKKVKEN